jgi:formate/nitrite transporter FocA (FNT family)
MLAYLAVFQHKPMLVVVTTATLVILSTLRDGIQHPYSSALVGSVAAAVFVAIAAWVWYRGSVTVVEED